MPNVAISPACFPPRLDPVRVAGTGLATAPRHAPGSAFWSHGVYLGISTLLGTTAQVDALSRHIATLPAPAQPPRPMVGQYLFMVKTLAAAWLGHSRPRLIGAAGALMHYGNTFTQRDAPLLGAALLRTGSGRPDAHLVATRLVDGLVRRLATPLATLTTLHRDFGCYLAQMAAASSELESDTVLVTQRLQADHVHAFILAQHVHALHERLAQASAAQRGYVQQGDEQQTDAQAGDLQAGDVQPGSQQQEAARLQVATCNAALEGVRMQLDRLRANQNATMEEALYLQELLPTVGRYLGTIDRLGVGIHATLAGTLSLQEHLAALLRRLTAGCADASAAHAELQASLPGWRDLAARLATLESAPA